jgi:hypothetical protein
VTAWQEQRPWRRDATFSSLMNLATRSYLTHRPRYCFSSLPLDANREAPARRRTSSSPNGPICSRTLSQIRLLAWRCLRFILLSLSMIPSMKAMIWVVISGDVRSTGSDFGRYLSGLATTRSTVPRGIRKYFAIFRLDESSRSKRWMTSLTLATLVTPISPYAWSRNLSI